MMQFIKFAELKIVKSEEVFIDNVVSRSFSLFEDTSWKRETMLANESMNKDQLNVAAQHYKTALKIAKALFEKYQRSNFSPESMVPIIIVSYLNLSEFWDEQGREDNEKACLIDAFDYLVNEFNRKDIPESLHNQIKHGLSKIFKEMVTVLREMGDFNTLEKKQSIYQELS